MRKGRTFLSSLAISAALSLPLPVSAQDVAPDTVVATVNGAEITIAHMILAAATLPQQYQNLPATTLYDAILDQLIQQEALRQSNPDMPDHVALALENETRSLMAGDALEKVMQSAATEGEIEEVYARDYANSGGETEYNASHILLDTEADAIAVVEALEGGADFAALAQERSTGPSGPNGGSLGWFGKGMMVPDFEAAVIGLELGQVSPPVQTQFGWHVIVLNDTRQTEAPELDAVREEIAAGLRREAVTKHIDTLVSQAEVDRPAIDGLNPDILRDLDLLRN
ncbi:MAG: peptidylprolyl isomerase [Rhodobacteraceae bacterium]|nr:peptidylprolyl isomerase [Paracoccaceae bacterium]